MTRFLRRLFGWNAISREEAEAVAALYRMGCSCGVITPDDFRDWGHAQRTIPLLLARLGVQFPA